MTIRLVGNRFANFRYTSDNNINIPTQTPQAPEAGIIQEWELSAAQIWRPNLKEDINFESLKGWQKASTEANGLLPISKYVQKTSRGAFEQNAEDYIVAQLSIESEQEEIKEFSFDYRYRILVFLNGQLLFQGNNAFRSKGLQHTGHLGINGNTLFLPLKQGKNQLQCIIIERGNGWGLMGKFKDMKGLKVQ